MKSAPRLRYVRRFTPGSRSPGYIVSPYAVLNGATDHTYYTQVNMTRTIEQILGLTPMNQFDLVASPIRTAFVEGKPPADNFKPWTHVANQIPLDQGVAVSAANTKDKLTKPDSEDPDTVNHLNWYMATGFKRPYLGKKKVRFPSEFNKPAPTGGDRDE